jgi:hypothetical protein
MISDIYIYNERRLWSEVSIFILVKKKIIDLSNEIIDITWNYYIGDFRKYFFVCPYILLNYVKQCRISFSLVYIYIYKIPPPIFNFSGYIWLCSLLLRFLFFSNEWDAASVFRIFRKVKDVITIIHGFFNYLRITHVWHINIQLK